MKEFYISPAIEIAEFIAEDILTASTISVGGFEYDVVNKGISVNENGEQRISDTQMGIASFEN